MKQSLKNLLMFLALVPGTFIVAKLSIVLTLFLFSDEDLCILSVITSVFGWIWLSMTTYFETSDGYVQS